MPSTALPATTPVTGHSADGSWTVPAAWKDDPVCDHHVACAFQTHYCTYIRVPRLLTLQPPADPEDLWLVTHYQWLELWFKVILVDLRAALARDVSTFEPLKLIRRGLELLQLMELGMEMAERVAVRELGLTKQLGERDLEHASTQFALITRLTGELDGLEKSSNRALGSAIRDYRERLETFRTRYEKLARETLFPGLRGPTYRDWLELDQLLDLQNGVKAEWTKEAQSPAGFWEPDALSADENMFIVVHQCFELWFRVILEQIDRAIPAMRTGDVPAATLLVERVNAVMRVLVSQIQVPATMQPLDFMRFREQRLEHDGHTLTTGLSPASGTESYQFREIEIASGLREDEVFKRYLEGSPKLPIRLLTRRQEERLEEPSLAEAFQEAVMARGLTRLDDLYTRSDEPNPNTDLVQLGEVLIEFDELFWLWRLNHVSMVEKMIGAKTGTGFLGPEYLMETAGIRMKEKNRVLEDRQIRPRFFEALWQVRTRLGNG